MNVANLAVRALRPRTMNFDIRETGRRIRAARFFPLRRQIYGGITSHERATGDDISIGWVKAAAARYY